MATYQKYPLYLDCVWLGVDDRSCLAAFITAGIAPVPDEVLEQQSMLIEDIESFILELPICTTTQLTCNVKNPSSFVALAERGFYVYDWTDINKIQSNLTGEYELVAMPLKPITTDKLSKVNLVTLFYSMIPVVFMDKSSLKIEHYKSCKNHQA
jgi:hypothetical protein